MNRKSRITLAVAVTLFVSIGGASAQTPTNPLYTNSGMRCNSGSSQYEHVGGAAELTFNTVGGFAICPVEAKPFLSSVNDLVEVHMIVDGPKGLPAHLCFKEPLVQAVCGPIVTHQGGSHKKMILKAPTTTMSAEAFAYIWMGGIKTHTIWSYLVYDRAHTP